MVENLTIRGYAKLDYVYNLYHYITLGDGRQSINRDLYLPITRISMMAWMTMWTTYHALTPSRFDLQATTMQRPWGFVLHIMGIYNQHQPTTSWRNPWAIFHVDNSWMHFGIDPNHMILRILDHAACHGRWAPGWKQEFVRMKMWR